MCKNLFSLLQMQMRRWPLTINNGSMCMFMWWKTNFVFQFDIPLNVSRWVRMPTIENIMLASWWVCVIWNDDYVFWGYYIGVTTQVLKENMILYFMNELNNFCFAKPTSFDILRQSNVIILIFFLFSLPQKMPWVFETCKNLDY